MMKKKLIIIALFFGILIIAAGCGKNYDSFAQCLTEKGAAMYGADWCTHCQEQKKMFGSSFKYVDYVNCDFNEGECIKKGIKGYPTWIINETDYRGVQSLQKLGYLTGCKPGQDMN